VPVLASGMPRGPRLAQASAATLAQKYPGDYDIETDASVVWRENFAAASIASVLQRYTDHFNAGGMSLSPDVPAHSPSKDSLQLKSGGINPKTYIYKNLGDGYEELYFRYYVKYIGDGPWHHSGLWIGGYNPPLPYPYPRAGLHPSGSDFFSLALESIDNTTMDLYTMWMGMHSWKDSPTGVPGDYYGNTLLHAAALRLQSDRWACYEIHLKLNPDPASGAGAILEVWKNDVLVRRFDDSGPPGWWGRDKFCPNDADDTQCIRYRPANPSLAPLVQRWRTTPALKINYFWPTNYNDAPASSSVRFADMVVATGRIGCTVSR
jgi:hypothetical protein